MASCRDCPCDSSSCRDSRQEAKSHGQSLQEAIYQAQQSRQEARDHGQSRGKSDMTDRLCRKRKLADSFIPCDNDVLPVGWLVVCFGFNGSLRQYFSLYRVVFKREGERGEKGIKNVQTNPTRTYCKRSRPLS